MAQKRLVCQVLIFTLMFFSCFVVFDLIAIEYEPNQLTRRSIINAVATVAVRIVKPTLNSRNCSKYINGLLYPQVT